MELSVDDLKRPKETTIEAVLVKERKQYAVAVSLGRCSSERGLLELVLSDSSGFVIPVLFLCIAFGFLVDWFDLKRKKAK
ncbi:hypothetical protein MUK42_15348 [Musa troglodytarum]|uniref:Uncharacterized protein n=1 Tax=Musa troglodytarum TaxID=320322 RepID=A0A9E7HYR9_9LILI|nr:hypothetical protein MUK42_15348 [Musa troglodytarum]